MMKIAIGMDLHAKTAVCFAVFVGEGEPRENHIEFLEEFNRKHRSRAKTRLIYSSVMRPDMKKEASERIRLARANGLLRHKDL